MSGWLALALTGPVLWAVSTHIDKYLVDRYFSNSDTAVLMVFTALLNVILLVPIGLLAHGVFAVELRDIAVLSASGALYMGAMLFYLRAIQGDEASVVATLFQASTLFTFLFSGALYLLFAATTYSALRLLTRRKIRDAVTLLIAGISLLDACLAANEGSIGLAIGAVAAFSLTRRLQRVVPGT